MSSQCIIHATLEFLFFFLMIRRPPRSTQSRSSAASDVYKRQCVPWPEKRGLEPGGATEVDTDRLSYLFRVSPGAQGVARHDGASGPFPGQQGEIDPFACDRIDQAGGISDEVPAGPGRRQGFE